MLDSLQKCLRYYTIAEVFKGLFNHALHVLLLCWVLYRLFDGEHEHFQCPFDSCPMQSGCLSFIQALSTVDVLHFSLYSPAVQQYMYIH